jgi:hypothetical protein
VSVSDEPFFGLFVFRYFEYVQQGEAFGRGQALDEPLQVAASSYQTKEIKVHTDDVLRLSPTLRDRMFGLAILGFPMLWYSLMVAFWFFVPSAYDFDEDDSLLLIAMPFALPLPFVIAGGALWTLPRTFAFDRVHDRLRISNGLRKRILLLDEVKSLQLIPGQAIQKGSRRTRRLRPMSYSTVQLNLVTENSAFPRINICHDAGRRAASEIARTLSSFLRIPLDDKTGLTEV